MLFPTLGLSSLFRCGAQHDERQANRRALCWSGMTDTEHSTTSGSNEVVRVLQLDIVQKTEKWSNKEYIKTPGVIFVSQSLVRIWSIIIWEFEVTRVGKGFKSNTVKHMKVLYL